MICDTRQTIQKRLTGDNSCAGTSCIATPVSLLLEHNMKTKKCTKCYIEKRLDEFSVSRGFYKSWCKPCTSAHERARRKGPQGDRVRMLDRRRKRKQWSGKRKPSDPRKIHAMQMAKMALRYGFIKKPDVCSDCGMPKRILAHHPDYSKPIDVVWLCHLCHCKAHREINKNSI